MVPEKKDAPSPAPTEAPTDSSRWIRDVEFNDLTFTTLIPTKDVEIRTNWTAVRDASTAGCATPSTKDHVILNHLNGTLKAGSNTLLLGSPGCGKTAFLKALAGRTPFRDPRTTLEGVVTVGGRPTSELHMTKMVGFVEQIDNHLPLMTVRQTLQFAAEVGDAGPNAVDDVVALLGLGAAVDTKVGNSFIRGCSGGERKRVTVGEMILRNQPLLVLDEITTGLDAATARDVVESLCRKDSTTIMSLLQPAPEIIELFDDVMLMTEGRIIYHGPASRAEEFFESLGYKNREGRSIGEFLLDLTTVRRHRYYHGDLKAAAAPANHVAGMTKAWLESSFATDRIAAEKTALPRGEDDVSPEYDVSKSSKFINTRSTEFLVLLKRQISLLWIDRLVIAGLLGQTVIMGVMMGIVFLKTPFAPEYPGDTVWMRNRYSVMFFTLMLFALNAFALIPWIVMQREVFYKQDASGMYRAGNFVWSNFFTEMITTVPQALLIITITYFMVQMTNKEAGDLGAVFGMWLLLALAFGITVSNMMRLVTYLCPTIITAFIINALVVSVSLLYGGFMIAEADLPPWVIWLYWSTPMSYVLRAVAITVFTSNTFAQDGLGEIALASLSFRTESYWIGAAFAYCVGFTLIIVFCQWLALITLKFGRSGRTGGGSWDDEEDVVELAKLEEENKADVQRQESATKLLDTLPCPKVDLSFSHMMYTVKVKKQDKVLVNDVNGHVTSGRMCAIVGATGAGKTTTQDLLAGRKTQGVQSGEVLLNGLPVTDRLKYQRIIGYCEQDDNHSAFSSVREAVRFSAALRLPPTTTPEVADDFVDGILESLSLDEIAHHKIGVKGRGGLSVGQFKRLTVAVELAANPAIIFLDEPTSGLDATAAETTMLAVKRLCDAGRTILCTIHQPSREVFSLFDDILLLQAGGRVAYHGPVDEMVSYFLGIPENHLPEPIGDYNASTYVLEVLGAGIAGQRTATPQRDALVVDGDDGDALESGELVKEYDYATHFERSDQGRAVLDKIEKARDVARADASAPSWPGPASALSAAAAVTSRWFMAYWRAPDYVVVRAVVFVVLSLILGATYFGEARTISDVAKAQSTVGVIFFQVSMTGMLTAIMCLGFVIQMRSVFYRERNTKIYSIPAFLLGSSVAELAYLFVAVLAQTIVFYLMLGMRADAKAVLLYFFFMFVQVLASTYLGHLLTSSTPSVTVAILACAALISTFAMFSGFLIPYEQCTPVLSWLFFLSPPRFAINGIIYSQYECDCAVDQNALAFTPGYTCDGGQVCLDVCQTSWPGCNVLAVPTPDGGVVHQTVWQFFQNAFGMLPLAWWKDMLPLIGFCVGFRLFDGLALATLNFNKR